MTKFGNMAGNLLVIVICKSEDKGYPDTGAIGTMRFFPSRIIIAIALSMCALGIAPAKAENCRGNPYTFNFRDPPDAYYAGFNMRRGTRCSKNFNIGYPYTFKQMILQTDPQHGTVQLRENGSILYTPNASYVGNDNWILRLCAEHASGRRGCADIYYAVTIE